MELNIRYQYLFYSKREICRPTWCITSPFLQLTSISNKWKCDFFLRYHQPKNSAHIFDNMYAWVCLFFFSWVCLNAAPDFLPPILTCTHYSLVPKNSVMAHLFLHIQRKSVFLQPACRFLAVCLNFHGFPLCLNSRYLEDWEELVRRKVFCISNCWDV